MSRSLYARLFARHATPGQRELLISRREALKLSIAGAAGLMLSSRMALARTPKDAKRVIVVGAGFGGLACAFELLSAGYDVKVLEARGRVGGRVLSFSDMVEGGNVEGGAELIGTNHPTWAAYMERFKLEKLEFGEGEDPEPVMVDGSVLSEEDAASMLEQMDAAMQKFNDDARAVNADEPWLTEKAAEWDRLSTGEYLRKLEMSDACRKMLIAQMESDNGVAIDRQSYLGNLTQIKGGGVETYWTDSETHRCKGGNQQLATKLAEALGDRVRLKKAVTAIKLGDKSATVAVAGEEPMECDHVVLAVPPSVWAKIKVEPGLPAELRPQMGLNLKYLAKFKSRFWQAEKKAADSYTNGPINQTWEATDNQDVKEAVLVGFSGGPAAAACREVAKDKRDSWYQDQLAKFYPTVREHFSSARFMDWPGDEWTMAGYSFPATGQVTTMGKTLREGIGAKDGPRLMFAGEHCCYKFVGYMEGALNSGADLAKRMAKMDGLA